MIASGEVFLLSGGSGGVFKPQSGFLNSNIRVLAAGLDRVFVACEPPVAPKDGPQRCSVWMFAGDSQEPVECPEFEAVEGGIREIAIGERHMLVLTHDGAVFSRGTATYGCVGHGGARDVPVFSPIPALRDKRVKFVAAGPYYSVAVTEGGDVYSWGQAFQGETGLFSCVDAVPRFSPAITPFRIVEVSCGNGHVLARTENSRCITWGENTCGQLGLGQKSKPTYKPQVLETLAQVMAVSAGWAHSVVVTADGNAYSWGLNSHGQLGLGDSHTRLAPELVASLADVHQVHRAQAARTFTAFRTADGSALLCGQVPHGPRQSESPSCLLVPTAMPLGSRAGAAPDDGAGWHELSELVAFDRGVIAFAPSAVRRVHPKLAPTTGSTVIRASVTGLPFQSPGDGQQKGPLIQDSIPAKVRLLSRESGLDVIIDGAVVAVDTVEFVTPNVCASRLGKLAEQNKTTLGSKLSVSVDGGLTWTQERDPASTGQAELWISPWPHAGPTHVEPACSPAAGGTELLFHVELPSALPDEHLAVKFVATPVHSVDDEPERAAYLATLARYDVTVPAWLDEGARGIRCTTPAFNAEDVRLYTYTVEVSLDGVVFLGHPLPFAVYDVRIVGLEPDLGPLLQPSQVRLMCKGLVHSDVHRVRLTFPESLGWAPRIVPGLLDHTTGDISFAIPELSAEIRQRLDEEEARQAQEAESAEAQGERGEAGEEEGEAKEPPPVDPEAGLSGTEVVVELSLDGQSFTEDGMCFAYHSRIEAGSCELLALPPGATPEPPKEEDKKAKKGGKSVVEEKPLELAVLAGSKLGVELKSGATPSSFAAVRLALMTKVGEEEPRPFRTVTLQASLESIAARAPSPPPEEPPAKGKNAQAPSPMPPPEDLPPRDMLTAIAPGIRSDELPEGATMLFGGVEVSLNGQSFVECPAGLMPMKLEPLPQTPTPQGA